VRPSQTPIVDRLIELIDDSQHQVRVTAIRSLGFIGPAAKRSSDKLIAVRDQETDETLRGEAARALELVRPIRTFED
jgi:HEAT repeat protein